MTLDIVVETLIKAVIVIGALLTGFAYLTLFERKVQARMQQRPGPNRVGPWGLLQPAADGLKLFFKSSSAPSSRDRFLYLLAPMISIMAALASFAIIPISGPGALNLFGHSIGWYVMNVNIGVLWYFAVTSVGVYGIFLAGYASNSKYSMLGALRSSAQMISYEMALGLSLVPVFILAAAAAFGALTIGAAAEPAATAPWELKPDMGYGYGKDGKTFAYKMGTKNASMLLKGAKGFPINDSLVGRREAGGTYAPLIYPSTYLACTIDCAWYLEMHPVSPNKTRMVHGALFPRDRLARPDFEEVSENYYERWDVTIEEDILASVRQQRAMPMDGCA